MIFSHQYNFFMIFNFLNIIIFLILFVGKAGAAEYFETNSINVINNGPINNLFQLTRPNIEPNHFTGAISLSTQLELSNYISSNLKQDESFFIDGETWVMRNNLSYQFSDNIIISASIPWYKHSGGKADSLIYNWHALFQLPQNGRTENNQDKIRWLIKSNNQTLLDIDKKMTGWGDASITAQLTPRISPSLRWTFMTKLPTGDYSDQTGSEKFDVGFALAQINPDWFKNRSVLSDFQLSIWYGAGLSYLGELKKLNELDQKPYAFTLRAGIAYAPFDHWHIKCQLDSQSPIYSTKIRELGWYPVLISFSTMHKLTNKTSLEFGIVEDIRPRSGPDVIFQTRLDTTF